MTHVRLTMRLERLALEVDFPLSPGVTALAGPPGSGKSLILECIAGFAWPDAGRILVEDAIVFDGATGVSLRPQRRRVGYIGSREALFPQMSVRRNLMFAAERWTRLERHKRVAGMAERFELAGAIEARPADLTPRQKLSAAVARALLAEPKVLLIDERGADEALIARVRDVFPGPVLMTMGSLDLAYAAADELILLEAGRVVQRGPARQVIEKPDSADAARLLGIANLFEGEIVALDPGRNTSRLACAGFMLVSGYQPGRFKGDRVTVAVRAEDVRVHSGDLEPGVNYVAAELVRVSERARRVRMEFASGIAAEVSREQYEKQRDNRSWQVEFPPSALRVF